MLFAVHVARSQSAHVTLFERKPIISRGLAYGAAHPDMMLNVRAHNMSAFGDDPDHFERWLDAHGHDRTSPFIARAIYGAYLESLFAQEQQTNPDAISVRRDEVIDVERTLAGPTVVTRSGERTLADLVVLAPGNLPPLPLAQLDCFAHDPSILVNDPWGADFARGLRSSDSVLLIGTGLTAVDVALALKTSGFDGPITALSRRGLLPHRHQIAPDPVPPLGARPPVIASKLLRAVRTRAREIGWYAAVDQIRPLTQILWSASSADARSRFLRHLRPWWDVHRHRIAPQIGERLNHLIDTGQLTQVAGKLIGAEQRSSGQADVSWKPRGASAVETRSFSRIINCTGPASNLSRITDPLLASLYRKGTIRPDPHGIGIDANRQSEVIGHDGVAAGDILILGPLTRGCFWEIVAVPDIRIQVAAVARRVTDAHWIGGEGL